MRACIKDNYYASFDTRSYRCFWEIHINARLDVNYWQTDGRMDIKSNSHNAPRYSQMRQNWYKNDAIYDKRDYFCVLFLLMSGKGCCLYLWHSLDFSLTIFYCLYINSILKRGLFSKERISSQRLILCCSSSQRVYFKKERIWANYYLDHN